MRVPVERALKELVELLMDPRSTDGTVDPVRMAVAVELYRDSFQLDRDGPVPLGA